MALGLLDDPARQPSAADLERALGRAHGAWRELRNVLGRELPGLEEEWAFAGKAFGWSLRLKLKKRVIVYLTPREKHFLAGFALGERAVAAAHEAGLDPALLALIDRAPRYAEGRGLRVEVRTQRAAADLARLAAIKAAH